MRLSPVKLVLLAFYAAALLSLVFTLPPAVAAVLQIGALALLAAHAIEAVVFMRYLKMYEGSLAASIVLTLLFGFLHWMPYKRRVERGA